MKVQDLGMNPGEDEKVQTNFTIRVDLSVAAADKLGILKDVDVTILVGSEAFCSPGAHGFLF